MKSFISSILLVAAFVAFTPGTGLHAQVISDVVFLAFDSNPNPQSTGNFDDWESIVASYTPTRVIRDDDTEVNISRSSLESELIQAGVGTHYFEYNSPVHGRLFYVVTVE